jgi:hypothetical protein
MPILVVLIAKHRLAQKIFENEGPVLLDKGRMPAVIADRAELLPRTFDPERAGKVTFETFISQGGAYEPAAQAPNINGVIVLCEQPLEYLLNGVRDAVFCACVPSIPYVENVRNFLIGNFRQLLGNYGFLVELTSDSTKGQAASLPLRNFDANELRDLVNVCRTLSLERTFQNEIVPRFNSLVRRRGPKRRSKYPHVYFKDEDSWYFQYGHEHHARYETGEPHTDCCTVNGQFRFGWPLDQERHFNVSIGDSDAKERVTCELPNCHGETVFTRDRTHINMFSNDFHA